MLTSNQYRREIDKITIAKFRLKGKISNYIDRISTNLRLIIRERLFPAGHTQERVVLYIMHGIWIYKAKERSRD
jgi:hypothetical protein